MASSLRRTLAALLLALAAFSARAETDLRFDRVEVYDFVRVVLGEILRRPFVIDPALLAPGHQTTVDMPRGTDVEVEQLLVEVLKQAGFQMVQRGSVWAVERARDARIGQKVFQYRPRYRTVSYLENAVRAFVFRGRFAGITTLSGQGAGIPALLGGAPGAAGPALGALPVSGGTPAATTQITPGGGIAAGSSDVVLYQGPADEVALVEELVRSLDVPAAEVVIRASVFEVQTTKSDSSAVSLALGLLGGHLSASVGAISGTPTIALKAGGFDAAVAFLAQDSRFKLVSTPSLRVTSGESGRVMVGADVPVLGAVTIPGNGAAPVQSVNYQGSGVSLDVHPVVLGSLVKLTLTQEVSNFTVTDNGVNNSPTLLKRSLRSVISLAGDEAVLLGGLDETSRTGARSAFSFLRAWPWSSSSSETRTELVLMLQAEVMR